MFNVIYTNYKKKKQKTMNTTKTPILGKISLINLPVTMEQSCQRQQMNHAEQITRAAGHTLNNRVDENVVNFFVFFFFLSCFGTNARMTIFQVENFDRTISRNGSPFAIPTNFTI